MKIPYTAIANYYKVVLTFHFCCAPMKKAWDENLVQFDDTGLGVGLIGKKGPAKDFYPIKFCPFCSEPIKTEEI